MTTSPTASRGGVEGAGRRIVEEVTSWPGVEAGPGRRGELSLRVGRREIGHLHGDRAAHFSFPKAVWARLRDEGRIVPHPVFPDKPGPAARRIDDHADVQDVIALLRLNYDRISAANGAAAFPELRASPPEPLTFAPRQQARAFRLRRGDRGDILVYSTRTAGAVGTNVARQYLNHWHEAMFAAPSITAPRFVHERDRDEAAKRHAVRATFSRRHTLDDDFEVVPSPGHTPGATAYVWDSGEHRFLFTGDTIYLRDGEWVAAVLASSDRAAYLESLALLRDLEFDVLVPWIATEGTPYAVAVDRDEARTRIDAIAERLRGGADG